MFKVSTNLTLQFSAALLAAPLLCVLYIIIFEHEVSNVFWLFSNPERLFFLILLYPVVEELFFRGVIQESINKKTKKYANLLYFSVANSITSILFMCMHFVHHEPFWAALTLFPSLIFGHFKEQFGHIMPSIILHIFYNFCYFSLIIDKF
jgi:membrane protease YdiL (CAAX protease family)